MASPAQVQARINEKMEEIVRDYSDGILSLLNEVNATRLNNAGRITANAILERRNLRWTLSWAQGSVSFNLNIVINVEDDGKQARVERVWVHRHASTPLDYDGHTPTTRMRRLAGLSIKEIREAIDQEWG